MRWLLALLVLLPSVAAADVSAWAFQARTGGGTAPGPRCDFSYQLPGVSGGAWVCDPSVEPLTTTRASECMTYTGSEWVTRGEDEACVDSQGLQAFGGYTQYVTESTDFSGWTLAGGATRSQNADGTWRVCLPGAAGASEGIYSSNMNTSIASGEIATATAYVRAGAGVSRFRVHACSSSECSRVWEATGDWQQIHATGARSDVQIARVIIYAEASAGACFDIAWANMTKTPRPMPRHDCGPSPCSRAGEVHTVDASGWSTDSFDIRVQYEPGLWPPGGNQVLVRTDAVYVAVQSSGLAILRANGVSAADGVAAVPANSNSRDYRASYDGGVWTLCVDGACSSGPGPAPNPHGVAYLGAADAAAIQPANGHIRLLRVSAP